MTRAVRRREAEPHANARALYVHLERYLAGCCNEGALDNLRLAYARSLELGVPLDQFLREVAGLYLEEYGLPGRANP